MARRFPAQVREDLGAGAGDDEAPPRRASAGPAEEGPRVERLEWAVVQRRPGARRDSGIVITKARELQVSVGARRGLGLSDGSTVGVGWSREHRHAVIRPIGEGDPRGVTMRKGGQVGRLAGKFLVARGYIPEVFYPGEVRDRELVVPLPAPKGAQAGRGDS